MTEYDISLTKDQVEGLLTNDEGLKGLVGRSRYRGERANLHHLIPRLIQSRSNLARIPSTGEIEHMRGNHHDSRDYLQTGL